MAETSGGVVFPTNRLFDKAMITNFQSGRAISTAFMSEDDLKVRHRIVTAQLVYKDSDRHCRSWYQVRCLFKKITFTISAENYIYYSVIPS
jgi:hypothetical protein